MNLSSPNFLSYCSKQLHCVVEKRRSKRLQNVRRTKFAFKNLKRKCGGATHFGTIQEFVGRATDLNLFSRFVERLRFRPLTHRCAPCKKQRGVFTRSRGEARISYMSFRPRGLLILRIEKGAPRLRAQLSCA